MADVVLLERYTHKLHELFQISSGAMRFKVKGRSANFWLIAKEKPYSELYEITIGPVCKIKNIKANEEKTVHFYDIINNEHFTEFWVSYFNYKVQFGYAGQRASILELDCFDDADYHNQVGYIKFNSKSTRFLNNITWLVEVPPVLNTSTPVIRKLIDGGELYWTAMISTRLPQDALIGGFQNEPTYIARSLHNYSLCPGRYIPSRHAALIPWGFVEHQKDEFEILCGFNAEWVKTRENDIPQNAFVAGYSEVDREPLYIGRAMHDGHLLTGKVHVMYKLCYLPYEGREIAVTSYEILVSANCQRRTL